MIVGLFNDSFPPIMDGVANAVRSYAYYINKKYGEAYVITPSFPGYEDKEEFEVIRYFSVPVVLRPPYRFGIPFLDKRALEKINKIPFDIIHVHSPFSSGVLGLYIARKKRIPIVASFHTKYYDDFKEATKSHLLAKFAVKIIIEFYNNVDEVWTVNNATLNTLREYGFKKNVKVIPNGTDFAPIEDKDKYRGIIKELYKLEEDIVLLFVGQMIKQKNIEMLLKAFSMLNREEINFKAFLVGSGKDEEYFKELSISLGLKDRVIFTGKILDRELLKAYYAGADLFVFPSLYDTSAIVIREAAAFGCPALVIEGSNVAEGIIDGVNGFLSPNDPFLYAQKIKEVISNEDLLKKVGEKAKESLYISWEKVVDMVVEEYTHLINLKKLNCNF